MTSSSGSLLKRTNQAWKLRIMYGGLVVAGALMVLGQSMSESLTTEQVVAITLSGVLVGLASFAFACLGIRCPKCKSRWLWRAVSTEQSGEWLLSLQSQQSCPACGANGAAA